MRGVLFPPLVPQNQTICLGLYLDPRHIPKCGTSFLHLGDIGGAMGPRWVPDGSPRPRPGMMYFPIPKWGRKIEKRPESWRKIPWGVFFPGKLSSTPERESYTPLLSPGYSKKSTDKKVEFLEWCFSGPQFAKMKNLKKQNELGKFKLKSWHILSWESQGTTMIP